MQINEYKGGRIHREILDAVNADLPIQSIELTPEEWEDWTYFLKTSGRRSPTGIAGKDMIMVRDVPVRRGK